MEHRGLPKGHVWYKDQNRPHPLLGKISSLKGKTIEEIMGKRRAKQKRKTQSISMIGKNIRNPEREYYCSYCLKTFKRRQCFVHSENVYCNRKCASFAREGIFSVNNGTFKKGHIPHNKGKPSPNKGKRTAKYITFSCAYCGKVNEKIKSQTIPNSKLYCNYICHNKDLIGKPSPFKGKTVFEIAKTRKEAKLRLEKQSISHIGKPQSIETRIKRSAKFQGVSIDEWNGFINPINDSIRKCTEYKQWRRAIFTRDNYTCQNCGGKQVYLHADHYPKMLAQLLKEYKIKTVDEGRRCKELWDINNGRTLCTKCHKKTPTYGKNKGAITKIMVNMVKK
jgi:hypothetical protein